MRTLYLRIYLTVVAVLLLFALVAGWLLQNKLEVEREQFRRINEERLEAWGELMQSALPPADAQAEEQAHALLAWSERLRLPLALDDRQGQRLATSPSYMRMLERRSKDRDPEGPGRGPGGGPGLDARQPIRLALTDGRALWLARPPLGGPRSEGGPPPRLPPEPWFVQGAGLLATLAVLFVAVAAGAYPVVRRLTRRLEHLKRGVEIFGGGQLDHRVDASGRDEIAAVAASFNGAASRIEALVRANQSLLANASHELRSPLARMKMALTMLPEPGNAQGAALQSEIDRNIRELDALVEEVLLASRLEARPEVQREPVDVLALAAEEAAHVGGLLEGVADDVPTVLVGDERLLRRALRNLLENARRYGGDAPPNLQIARVEHVDGVRVELRVCDRGTGVPEAQRERIFEPFYRMPGHAEREGGVGLGLSLVRQIAQLHGGQVRCNERPGGGSCFSISLPVG